MYTYTMQTEASRSTGNRTWYADGNDYSHLQPNCPDDPDHEECLYCGSNKVTITDDLDICHGCGEGYS